MLGFRGLPRSARNYIIGLLVLAIILGFYFVRFLLDGNYRGAVESSQVPVAVVVFSILALVAGLKPISTPAGDQRTVSTPALVASVLLVGPEYAVIPAAVMVIGTHVVMRRPFPRLLFNLTQYILTVGLSGLLYFSLRSLFGLEPAATSVSREIDSLRFDSVPAFVALAAFLFTYFILNTVFVAIVMAFTQDAKVVATYRESTALVVGHLLDSLVIGVIAAILWALAPWTIILVGVLVLFIYNSYSLAVSLEVAQSDLLKRMGELQRRTAELELLGQVNAALTRAADLPGLWGMLAEQVGRIIDTTSFFIALSDQASGQIRIAYGQDEGVQVVDQMLPPGAGLTRWIIEQSRPLLIQDYQHEAGGYPKPVVWGSGRQPESLLAVPMILDGRVLGAICAQAYRKSAYSEEDLSLLSAIAGQAAVAITNARLQKEAAEVNAIRQLDLLKTQFISTVSHELRSPLTPIVGYSELITMDEYDPAQVREMAGEINRAAVHMQLLVDDLLDLSRIETGRLKLILQPLDLRELVRDAARGFEGTSASHRISVECPETLPTIVADRVRIRQVLDNLLSNAIKYSPEGGDVTVQSTVNQSEVRIAVSDRGPGIPLDKQARLFEAFYRVEGELTKRVRGTGLGLAISRHLVELHGGQIWVESQVGRGSTFTFSLPIVSPSDLADRPTESIYASTVN